MCGINLDRKGAFPPSFMAPQLSLYSSVSKHLFPPGFKIIMEQIMVN